MDPELYQRAQALFDEVVDAPRSAREARLGPLRAEDPALVSYVEKLLALEDAEGTLGVVSRVVEDAAGVPEPAGALLHPGDAAGPYRALRRLGVGGMAEVWAVEHTVLGTRHALKVLLRASGAMRDRLLREGMAQARLQHPNVVPVRDVVDVGGVPALLMPLVPGPSLGALLRAAPPSPAEALALFDGVLAGVAHVHAAGLVHRDLKPDNVLLQPVQDTWVPRVADFGLVKGGAAAGVTATGMLMGTPSYAAPEQLRDASSVDARADLFSLGVLLVRLVAGHLPFPGRDLAEIRAAHAGAPDLSGVPDDLLPIVTALLAPDPEDRLPSVALLQERLAGLRLDRSAPRVRPDALSVMHTDLPSPVPTAPIEASQVVRHGVPRLRDRFIGRTDALQSLAEQLAMPAGAGRLVTLTGAGGAGKTRLCAELAWSRATGWQHVWWVDLVEARDAAGVEAAVAAALGVELRGDATQAIATALGSHGRSLVILDNFEQVAEHAAATVGAWLDASEEPVFLVTSRVPLRLRGERVVPLGPLTGSDAARLFADRARAAGAEVSALDPAVAELVALLDHLPLAIELAAARSRGRPPGAMVARLSRRFQLLTSRSPDLHDRHRTLRNTLDWSWNLLSPEEQQVLAWCSVFEGGFSVEDAEAVLEAVDPGLFVDQVIADLVDHSLVRALGGGRLGLLVSVQAYAEERRVAWSAEEGELFAAHARWFARRMRGLGARLAERQPVAHVERFEVDLDNLRAAVERAERTGDGEATALAALGAIAVLLIQGNLRGARVIAQAALPSAPEGVLRARLQGELGVLLRAAGEGEEALRLLRAAVEELGEDGPALLRADLYSEVGHPGCRLSQPERRAALERSLAAHPTPHGWYTLGVVHDESGRREEAQRCLERALAQAEAEGDYTVAARAMNSLCIMMRRRRELDAMVEGLRRAHDLATRSRDPRVLSSVELRMSLLHLARGEFAEGAAVAETVLARVEALGEIRLAGQARFSLAQVAIRVGRHAEAERRFGELAERWRRLGMQGLEIRDRVNLVSVQGEMGRFDAAEANLARLAEIAAAPDRQFASLALALPVFRASIRLLAGDAPGCVALLDTLSEADLDRDPWLGLVGRYRRLEALLALGRLEEAAAGVERLEAAAGRIHDVNLSADALVVVGRVHAARGEHARAVAVLEEVRERTLAFGARQEALHAVLVLGTLPGRDPAAALAEADALQEGIDVLPETICLRAALVAHAGVHRPGTGAAEPSVP